MIYHAFLCTREEICGQSMHGWKALIWLLTKISLMDCIPWKFRNNRQFDEIQELSFRGSPGAEHVRLWSQEESVWNDTLSEDFCRWSRLWSGYRLLFSRSLRFPIIIVSATLGVAGAILYESFLSYLGIGVVPPTPSWGNMISAANDMIVFKKRPWLWIPPGICILITVVAINLIGDGLRDALDPKTKK